MHVSRKFPSWCCEPEEGKQARIMSSRIVGVLGGQDRGKKNGIPISSSSGEIVGACYPGNALHKMCKNSLEQQLQVKSLFFHPPYLVEVASSESSAPFPFPAWWRGWECRVSTVVGVGMGGSGFKSLSLAEERGSASPVLLCQVGKRQWVGWGVTPLKMLLPGNLLKRTFVLPLEEMLA